MNVPIIKKDTKKEYADRCEQNNKNLTQAKRDFKKIFKEMKDV